MVAKKLRIDRDATADLLFAIMTATYAVLSLSGGVVGSVVATQRWPQVLAFLKRERLPSFPSFPASPAGIEKQED